MIRSGQWALHYIPNPSELEETSCQEASCALAVGVGYQIDLQQGFFFSWLIYGLVEREKPSTFESCKNMSVKAALLCLAACVCDTMSMAGQCVTSVDYILSQPFSALCSWRGNRNGWTFRRAAGKQKGIFEANWQKNHTKSAKGSICLLSVFRPTCVLILTQWQFHRSWGKGADLLLGSELND